MSDLWGRVVGHYERHALSWDADRRNASWNDRRWLERLVEALPSSATILDLGCGAGQPIAHHLVELGFGVTGVDTSETLISLCRGRMPNMEWIVADMRSVALGKRFDGILAWDSFFHLNPDDQRRMFAVFAEHASRSAALMFNTGPAHGEAIGSYRGDPLYHASLSPDEYRALLRDARFEVIAHAVEDPHAGGRTVWLARSTTS